METIERADLIHRLEAASAGVVTISAGPGFGKSTLIKQWSRRRGGRWARAIDDGDLSRALAAATPRLLDDSGESELFTLVVDDFQELADASRELISALLRGRPRNLRLVLSGRSDPDLDLAALRVAGELYEIGPHDLRFTDAEWRRLLSATGIDLAEDAIALLHQRTEGWPAGLSLAIRGLNADGRDYSRFGGASRGVADYLRQELLSDLDRDSLAFVSATSILAELSGPLCDAVVGEEAGSAQRLIELERRCRGFVMPLDDRGERFRYHPMLGEMLRHELRLAPARLRALHGRAGAWFARNSAVEEAVDHLLAADDSEAAISLVCDSYMPAVERGQVKRVEGWLSRFPRDAITADARLSIVEAWAMSFQRRQADAEVALENAKAGGYRGPLPDGAASIESSAALIRAGFPTGHVGKMLDAAHLAFELEKRTGSPWRVTVHMMLALALYFDGKLEEAIPLLEQAAALARTNRRSLEEVGTRCVRAWAALANGEAKDAMIWSSEALEVASASGLDATPYGGYATATHGAILAAKDPGAPAAEALERGLAKMEAGVEPLMVAQCLLALAGTRLALGEDERAKACVADATTALAGFTDAGLVGDELVRLKTSILGEPPPLTPRELEVLSLLDQDLTEREMAERLFVSFNTIHSHVKSIYRKLDCSTRAEVLRNARALEVLTSPKDVAADH